MKVGADSVLERLEERIVAATSKAADEMIGYIETPEEAGAILLAFSTLRRFLVDAMWAEIERHANSV